MNTKDDYEKIFALKLEQCFECHDTAEIVISENKMLCSSCAEKFYEALSNIIKIKQSNDASESC